MTVLVKVYLIVIAAVAGSSMRMAWFLSRPADFVAAILMVFFMNVSLAASSNPGSFNGLMTFKLRRPTFLAL